jgi:hypothetical protein
MNLVGKNSRKLTLMITFITTLVFINSFYSDQVSVVVAIHDSGGTVVLMVVFKYVVRVLPTAISTAA